MTTQLPSTVQIAVTEWQPEVLLRHAAATTFVAGNGATLPFTQSTAAARQGIPLLLDYRPGAQQPLLPGLADLLASAAQRWPSVYGCGLAAFVVSNGNILSAWTSTGWQAIFGALDSTDAVAAVPGQLAVLAALEGPPRLHPPVVRVRRPREPDHAGDRRPPRRAGRPSRRHRRAACWRRRRRRRPTDRRQRPAAAGAAPSPTPKPAPTATPAPTPRPTPSPLVLSLPPPRHS